MKKLLLFGLSASSLMAIVAIEPIDIGTKEKSNNSEINFDLSNSYGNSQTQKINIGAKTDHSNNTHYAFILGNYSYGKAKNKVNIDKYFIHARYLQTLYKKNVFEFFSQAESNVFQKLQLKLLLGTGLRFKTMKTLYLGSGLMRVEEKLKNKSVDKYDMANIYISYKNIFKFKTPLKMVYNIYYQPRLSDPNDCNIIQNIYFSIPLNSHLNIQFKINYKHDSTPAVGVKKEDISQQTSITYIF